MDMLRENQYRGFFWNDVAGFRNPMTLFLKDLFRVHLAAPETVVAFPGC